MEALIVVVEYPVSLAFERASVGLCRGLVGPESKGTDGSTRFSISMARGGSVADYRWPKLPRARHSEQSDSSLRRTEAKSGKRVSRIRPDFPDADSPRTRPQRRVSHWGGSSRRKRLSEPDIDYSETSPRGRELCTKLHYSFKTCLLSLLAGSRILELDPLAGFEPRGLDRIVFRAGFTRG